MGSCCSRGTKEGEDIVVEESTESKESTESTESKECAKAEEVTIDAKHLRYDRFGPGRVLFWGIGIENETYLEWSERWGADAFRRLLPKRERYSVDYYKSFEPVALDRVLGHLKRLGTVTYPVLLNAHTLQKTDRRGEHRTRYDTEGSRNPAFGESLHDALMREVDVYREMADRWVVFDGDTIEFMTQDFYCATVSSAVGEWCDVKARWLAGIGPWLSRLALASREWCLPVGVEGGHFQFAEPGSAGLATFLTTRQRNLALCNTQTIHLNLTLPTWLEDGVIVDRAGFLRDHLAWVRAIQVLEPLIVAVYGTPDVFAVVDSSYVMGSQRVARSRYISLQSYDVSAAVFGKLLLQGRPEDPSHWYNRLMSGGPYVAGKEIGYDVNVAKFRNHGIELRFLDAVGAEAVQGLLELIVLLGAHVVARGGLVSAVPVDTDLVLECLQRGFGARLTVAQQVAIGRELGIKMDCVEEGAGLRSAYEVLCAVSSWLWRQYKDSEIVAKMVGPMARAPVIIAENERAYLRMYRGVYGRRPLVLRAEASVFEQRTVLCPSEVALLLEDWTVMVETSPYRCFTDQAYRDAGAVIVPEGTWSTVEGAAVLGLKSPRAGMSLAGALASQTLFHFAHAFNGQEGWRAVVEGIGAATLVDYEYMTDDAGARTLSFCAAAGRVGAWLGAMTAVTAVTEIGPYDEAAFERTLCGAKQPRILVIGRGTVGRAVKAALDRIGWSCDMVGRGAITTEMLLGYEVVFLAIRLTAPCGVWLRPSDLDRPRCLRLLVDISCELGHPWNPVPVYDQYGTREAPVQRIRDDFHVLAVPYLPSFDPVRSSAEFSQGLVWYLSEWKWVRPQPWRSFATRAMNRAIEAWHDVLRRVNTV
jgi:uncharacterized protein